MGFDGGELWLRFGLAPTSPKCLDNLRMLVHNNPIMSTSKEVKARYRERHREELRDKGREAYHHNPRKHKNNWLKRRYGITIEQYDEMVATQNNCCALCKQPEKAIHWSSGEIKPLSVDHNHNNGKPRGLLCFKCNYTIGIMEASPDRLDSFRKYLEEWEEKHGIMVL